MVKELERNNSVSVKNKQNAIIVEPFFEQKMISFKKALFEGKDFVIAKTAMKKNMGFACEKDVVIQMYIFREQAAEYAKQNGIEIDIFEKYEDDEFAYETELIIRKKTTNI